MILGGLEAGGTKMVCAIGNEQGEIFKKISLPTETPEITMPKMIDFFQSEHIEALGVGCFGPIDLDKKSKTYGFITSTPKLAWANFNIIGAFQDALHVPVGFDTDVNVACLGEVVWGASKDCEVALYITIGTGVGVGVYVNGKPLHGLVHPEGGHILLAKHPDDTYKGRCPYHANCIEGLAAGPAIEERWGKKAIELADRPEVWELEADYIAQALVNYIVTLSPNKIVLWGGVMHQEQLFSMIRENVVQKLNGYVHHKAILEDIEHYIVPPALGDEPGIKGALYLGYLELQQN